MSVKYVIKNVVKQLFSKRPVIIKANVIQLSPSELLKGRCALITGGTSGIGLSIAQAMLDAGAIVCITGRSQERIDKALLALQKVTGCDEDRLKGCILNNIDVSSFNKRFEAITTSLAGKKIDILVNNAGISAGTFGTTSENDYDSVLATNLKSTYFLSQTVAKYMKDNHIEGNILNIASSSSLRPANSPYIISKWGIRGLTLGLAKMLIPYGITVNGLAPGPTATPMLNRDENCGLENPSNPMGRLVTSREVANMAVVLVSRISKAVVGDIIYMTGGAGTITFDDVDCNF